jgi:FlaA1/EpsC-like NDP-sugar epimerase
MYLLHLFQSGFDRILRWPRVVKRGFAITADIVIGLLAVALAYRLRLDVWVMPEGNQWLSYIVAILIAAPIFTWFGLYRVIFRYVGWGAFFSIAKACLLYGAIYSAIFSVIGILSIPRSVGILQPILLFVLICGFRSTVRYLLGNSSTNILTKRSRRLVLIYGAGSAGRQLAAGLANSQEMEVAGFVDDDPTLQGSILNGKQIYREDQMVQMIEDLDIADVLLAIPSASRRRRNEIIDSLRSYAVSVRTLPGIFELADGQVTVSDLRPLDIEDLLGRDPVAPDPALMSKNITGKSVLVTGAGGSIGSELCRQIFAMNPAKLILLDHSEFSLYAIDHELNGLRNVQRAGPQTIALLGSVQDAGRIDEILQTYKPATIYHAAAYKHVPLVEANPSEGVRNNVFGTRTIARAAMAHAVENFVLISTDKAVRPPNMMGASKRMAEMLLQSMAAGQSATCFSMVRFGNVLGSSGSVVPLFRKQIAAGGPVTVTHPEVTRYFMTIPEAAQLVIQAGAMASGGEVFVLEMGEPVRIVDLARRMIELSGLRVLDEANESGDIAIKIVGLRPAEKLYEELLIGDSPEPTKHSRILKALDTFPPIEQLDQVLAELETAAANGDEALIRKRTAELVPSISPDRALAEAAE